MKEQRWIAMRRCAGESPPPRSGAASIVVDGTLFIFGGYGGGGRLDDFHSFNFETKRWSCVEVLGGTAPGMRENNGLVEHKRCLYIFGGYNGAQWLNDMFCFDLATREWRSVDQSGQPPDSRFGYVSFVSAEYFYVWGGYDGTTWLNDMHQFNFETKTWSVVRAAGQIPSIRSCPSWCCEGKYVYVFGGYDGVQRMNDLFRFNVETHAWRQLGCGGTLPSPRYFHACAVYGASLVVFGGYNGSDRLNDMYEYNFDLARWAQLEVIPGGDAPSGRSSLIAQVYKNALFVFGGYNGQNVLNDFWCFRFEPVKIPPPTLLEDLGRLVNDRDLSDVVFIVEGQRVYASRIHLAARSEHFRAMLYGGMRESTSAEIELKDVSHEVFLAMVQYLYTDTVSVSPSIAIPLMVASELYLLDRLKSLCEDKIRQNIGVENVISVFLAAKRHRADALKDICLDFILEHLEAVKLDNSFNELKQEPELLMEIIMRSR